MESAVTMFSHLQIPLEDVVKATHNFDDKYVIGEGGFGKVYRGQLLRSGKLENIVARRLDRHHGQGDVEFWTEISVLASLKHENIVSLIGFCDENGLKIIINKREASKGSLSMYLGDMSLTWIQRLKICVGVARALRHIHEGEGRGYGVIHRNINSWTVLLDDNWEAKLSGFEFSIKQSADRMDRVVLSEPIGTTGYMDPETEKTGGVTHKSDIYSFGVVLCEILCGRKAFIPDGDERFVAPLFRIHYEKRSLNDIIHPDLRFQMTQQSLVSFSKAAYSCLKEDRVQRPNMNDIVFELEKALELQQPLENLIKKLEHLKIPLSDIMLATDNFSEEYQITLPVRQYELYIAELEHFDEENPSIRELGKNKGEPPRRRNTVAIYRIIQSEDENGEEMFYKEIKMLDTCKHPNIVKLIGFCYEGSEMIVVVELFSKGHLFNYWLDNNLKHILTWEKRLKICLDVANALNYLHSEMEDQKTIIHRDIKSSNIALDENLRAKILSFGISVFLPPNQDDDALHHKSRGGNSAYMDAEYRKTGKLKRESDVYSFGVVLFEVLCGRLAYDSIYEKESSMFGLAFVARRCFQEGTLMEMIDPVLKKRGPNKDSLEKFVKIAHDCIAETQDQRPTMKVVIQELQKALFFQVDDEVKKSMELKLTHKNIVKELKHLKIPFNDIMLATDNFSKAYQIRDTNGFYDLYRGELEHFDEENPFIKELGKNNGERPNTVVIKRIFPREGGKGEEVFYTEIKMLYTCKHPNIVKLLGFCDEGSEMIIVFEHLSNGYLDDYWRYKTNDMKHALTWAKRLKICLDVANALNYLHAEMEDQKTIIHRDFKSSNIALDENWGAKIVDFGHSVFMPPNQDDEALYHKTFYGTRVYIDPEYRHIGRLKRESDVYNFGVVLFEVLCGRLAFHPIYLKENDELGLAFVAWRCFREGTLMEMIDPMLKGESGENDFSLNRRPNKDSLEKFVKIAHDCIAETQDQRPTMKVVIKELQEVLFFQIKHLEHLKIPLSDIRLATDNFSKAYQIKDTRLYRAVNHSMKEIFYKGELPGRRDTVLIRRFLRTENEKREEMFYNEIKALETCKHPSIVKLLGFCYEDSEMILVVEHFSNGCLADYWWDKNNGTRHILTWEKRLKICIDVASALNYLHTEMEDQKTVIHCDIQSSNIALDENWGAKIVDFRFSKFLPPNQDDAALYHKDVLLIYVCTDPEYTVTGELKRESDVYSFGVLLWEVLCGREAYDPIYAKESKQGLAFVARRCFQEGTLMEMIDPILKEESDGNNFSPPDKDSLEKFVKIAHQCIAETQDQRPTMKVVIQELHEALFFQGEELQPLDMVHLADEVEQSIELKLTREKFEDKTQHPDTVQVVDEVKESMKPKLTNANSIKHLEHLKISLSDIMLATDSFSKAYKIRDTTYYDLYRGELEHFDEENPSNKELGKNKSELPRRRSTVVIYRFFPDENEKGEEMFYNEIKALETCKHPCIVKLLGFCHEDSHMILVVKHLSNVCLADYWSDKTNGTRHILTWAKRLKICLDVANALNYLHTEMEGQKTIIHGFIRSDNIALDENWGAKIFDFRFSKFLPPNQDDDALYQEDVWGMLGYVDPEYVATGKLKRESDVYSFGVVMFEVLCGRLTVDPIYLKESEMLGLAFVASRCIQEGTLMEMIDPILKEESGENVFSLSRGPNEDSLEKFVKIAYDCIAVLQHQRPTMKVVIKELQEALFFQENNKDDLIISLQDIKLATEDFRDDNCVGGGGFGKVYKGKVPQGDGFNTIVAKRLDTRLGQGQQQFRNELQILFEYKHEKLIRLVGYCDEKNEQIIVYEYASRGSLDRYLKDSRLTWRKRLDICIDVATALDFLHGGAGKQAIVIHRDIKTANILLNDEWDAKLADFGLSLISPINKETDYVIDHACGTKGYLDPLYLKSGFLTKESDIYSFGVVLFEILCGRSTFEVRKHKGQYLPGFIKDSLEKGKHDDLVYEALKEQIVPKALTAFQTIASQCLHDDREKRPTAKDVLTQLKEALEFQISDGAAYCMEVQLDNI